MLTGIEGYLDMMPHVWPSMDNPAQSLAGRLEVVRSYVQEDSESGGDNSDESSIASLGGSDEHLPKERAYSVGCKPSSLSGQLHLRVKTGASRPPKPPGRTAERSTEGSRQRCHDSLGITSGLKPLRKISAPGRPDHFQRQSSDAAAPKGADQDKADHGTAEGSIRLRTSTLPWDLVRGVRSANFDDPLRPRSSSGGNAASIQEAIRSRIATARQASSLSMSSMRPAGGYSDTVHQLTQRRELVCAPDSTETGEYVEMHCPASS